MRFSLSNAIRPKFLSAIFTLLAAMASGAPAVAATSAISQISGGDHHTCAVTTTGAAKCWGWNAYGELGDGSKTLRTAMTDVTGLNSGVASISAGAYHTCAVTGNGAALCWGANYQGQLGIGTTANESLTPTQVTNLGSGVAAIRSGTSFSCALTTAGAVKCWGQNNHGQLGNGSIINSNLPTQVTGLTSGVTAISVGADHSCARTSAGGLKCWGNAVNGMLGYNAPAAYQTTPVNVENFASGAAAVSAGYSFSCALTNAGGVQCWGYNNKGQTGNTAPIGSQSPQAMVIPGLANIKSIVTGGGHGCAINADNGVQCWGYNDEGQVGDNSQVDRSVPITVAKLSDITALAAGWKHTCALNSKGNVYCWGNNDEGQLGEKPKQHPRRLTPVLVGQSRSGSATNLLLLN